MTASDPVEPIAVIGMASSFANEAQDTEKLWATLLQGKSQMRPFPEDRMNLDAHFHSDPERGGTIKTVGGHFIKEDISRFDAPFFGISQAEAVLMDPQQRLLLENVYQALENSGVTLEQAQGSNTSVYVGSFCDDYRSILATDPDQNLKHKITGTYDTILANRVSWFFDFKGNSVVVDTACSSSLVALHMACQNLRLKECDAAIASGVNLICDPRICQDLTKLGAISPDGLSYSFDSRANGYSRGEGLGSVVIKRLSDAVSNGDTIRAVIYASGANHDGRTKGIFAPSSEAQERLVRETYKHADLGYKYTSYIEAHGTGTAVGDPTEVRALVSAFKGRPTDHPLYIGAVKSTLGHTEGAAGILGVIKTILILESGVIPPNVNLEELNPAINASEWNVVFPTSAKPWPTTGPRFASVNSFGFGGSNAHIVLGDALHSLEMRDVHASHRTIRNPPLASEIIGMVDRASGLPGQPLDLATQDLKVEHEEEDTGSSGEDQPALPFVLSSSDENGITRASESLIEYLTSSEDSFDPVKHIMDLSASPSSSRRQFFIRSYNNDRDEWSLHCTGQVSVEYERSNTIFNAEDEIFAEACMSEQLLSQKQSLCRSSIDFDKIYQKAEDIGIQFGPLFRNLSEVKIHHEANEVGDLLGTITVPDIARCMPHGAVYPHVAHPAMLDSLMHSVYGSVCSLEGTGTNFEMYLPTHIGEVWIASDISSDVGHKFLCHNSTRQESPTAMKSDITLWDKASSKLQVQFKDVDLTHVDSSQKMANRSITCHCVDWKQDIESLKENDIREKDTDCIKGLLPLEKLELTASLFIKSVLPNLEERVARNTLPAHLNSYMSWMRRTLDSIESGNHPLITPEALQRHAEDLGALDQLHESTSASSANGSLCIRMGLNMPRILEKEADPLELMFGDDDLMNAVYREVFAAGNLPDHLATYLGYLGHQKNELQVLEIGAGTGSTTIHVLNSLCPLGSCLPWSIKEFVFTDISAGFMEEASKIFKAWEGIMSYKTFDVERNPAQQGLQPGSFDLIIAGNVLHATKSLSTTLRNVRALLKPQGRLVLHELVSPQFCFLPFSFGLLPGWWSSKDTFRTTGPLLDEGSWNNILQRNGFTGADLVLPDSTDENAHVSSIIVAGAAEERKGQFPLTTASVIDLCPRNTAPCISECISYELTQSFGIGDSRVVQLTEALQDEVQDSVYNVVADTSLSYWQSASNEEFDNIKRVLNEAHNLLWISIHDGTPQFATSTGLLRTARSESLSTDRNLTTLDMNTQTNSQELIQQTISDVFYRQFLLQSAQPNEQYRLENGHLQIARLKESQRLEKFTRQIDGITPQVPPSTRAFNQPFRRGLKLHIQASRQLDTLAFVDDQTLLPPIEESQIEVEIKTAGVNFRDLLVAMGDIQRSFFGVEGAGIVTEVGAQVNQLQVGDRVMILSDPGRTGTIRTFCRTQESLAVKIPDEISFETACSLPVLGCTVIYSLRDVAQLSAGDTILIHAGSGGTGQLAIQYARSVGAEIFTTVSSVEKRQLVMDQYDIPKNHILYSRDTTFAKQIKRATSGRGVDVVLNSLGGDLLRHSWSCIAPLGRFVELGKRDMYGNGRLDMSSFAGGTTFAAVDLVEMMKLRPSVVHGLLVDTLRLYLENIISPPHPVTTLKFSGSSDALRRLQTGKSTGKIVLVSSPEDVVLTLPPAPSKLRLPSNASFVIAGGLGGLGRSIARWMASCGARNLIFLSRSGGESPQARELIDHLNTVDCTAIMVRCDITDSDSLHTAIQSVSHLPPIRGCIQAAMQLRDASLSTMTLDDFNAAVSPKTQGSWNLHCILPQDLNFFVMLSSVCGIMGNRGQGNYAAGNTYQDELARYRSELGMPTFSIDLGVVTSAGYVAENLTSKRNLDSHLSAKMDGLSEEDIFQALEYCLLPDNSPLDHPGAHQIVLGLDTVEILQPQKNDTEIPSYARHALWTHVRGESRVHQDQASSGDHAVSHGDIHDSTSEQLKRAESVNAAKDTILNAIQNKLSNMLSIESTDVDATKKLSDYGVDSLVAVEFRSWMAKDVGADIPVLDIVGSDSIEAICARVVGLSKFVGDDVKK
ncbi:unnamed protein product [Penicillium salamii]|nr:unnamed protein product [Penicillium salamii]CAG8077835.1 unnamed protein product [Penicillium salamii]CAG8374120.1 unnamed protein product [Penicillium salamii]